MKRTQTPSPTRSPSRCGGKCATGSFSHSSTWSRFGLASAPKSSASNTAELAAGDDDGRARDLDPFDPVGRALRARVQPRRPADLLALADLDLLAERDPAVTRQVNGERARGRSGGRVLDDADRRREHP